MKQQNRTTRQLRIEFVKSGAVLLLSVILLLSVVVAWFSEDEPAFIEPFGVSIQTGEDGYELGLDIITEKEIILPSATVLGDATISELDFSKSIYIMTPNVASPQLKTVNIDIDTAPGLHYYIDLNYGANNADNKALYYATEIYNNFMANKDLAEPDYCYDKDTTLDFNQNEYNSKDEEYQHRIAIVLWADYDFVMEDGRTIGQTINEEGTVGLNAIFSFTQ